MLKYCPSLSIRILSLERPNNILNIKLAGILTKTIGFELKTYMNDLHDIDNRFRISGR